MNSKNKGKRGELEVAAILREHGYTDARRTAQYCGNTGEADDVIGLPDFHLEVKRVEKLNLHEAIVQAKRDSKEKHWAVVHRRNQERWNITMDFEEFLNVLQG